MVVSDEECHGDEDDDVNNNNDDNNNELKLDAVHTDIPQKQTNLQKNPERGWMNHVSNFL